MNLKIKNLMNTVIENDYCIGCGVCASVEDTPFKMQFNEDGKYRPVLKNDMQEINQKLNSVCPFSDESLNETEIAQFHFEENATGYDEYAGYYLKNFAGYVTEDRYRVKGSSGGMGNWIAGKLLDENKVDGVIHVKQTNNSDKLFEYTISYDVDELSEGAKSRYYPIELSKVLKLVKENKGKYALVGIPCFIKSVRSLAKQEEIINQRIKYYIGLVCGHLKSDMFAKSIGWQLGIDPDNLTEIDFRKKLPDRGANDYGVEVGGFVEGEKTVKSSPTKELYTTNWGQGFFKYNACDYCDDVLAETADITVGDAWLPEYTSDYLGTNVVTVRHPDILDIIQKNIDMGNLQLDEISSEKVYQSQAGGFRHRRDGLSYRLHLKDQQNKWRPKKRVEANANMKSKRKKVYDYRLLLSKESFTAYHNARKENDFSEIQRHMDPFIKGYNKVVKPSYLRKALGKIKRTIIPR